MEADYANTRAELDTAMDAELRHMVSELSDIWWAAQDVQKRLSRVITDIHNSSQMLAEMIRQVHPQELPLEDRGQQPDH